MHEKVLLTRMLRQRIREFDPSVTQDSRPSKNGDCMGSLIFHFGLGAPIVRQDGLLITRTVGEGSMARTKGW